MTEAERLAALPPARRQRFRPLPFEVYTERQLDRIPQLARLSPEHRFAMRAVASVLPFRVNRYVTDQLIDWDQVPEDPLFQLTFPQPGMLSDQDFGAVAALLRSGADAATLRAGVTAIRTRLNPHPGGQQLLNVPTLDGRPAEGIQHKYRETVLFFPAQGQTCHSYCTFCFRWAQFVGDREQRFAASEVDTLRRYLLAHPEVTDLLVTGGDPLVMKAAHLARYLDPLLDPELEHLQTIRIGTKSLSFWPYRFVTDPDADALLRLFERLVESGKHLAVMAHYNHWRELETPIAREAIRRVRDTGAVIRTQSPLLAHINDDAAVWSRMWRTQVRLGMVPYYMFVERDTGACRYFQVPLARAVTLFRQAVRRVSGVAKTVRGPSMSAGPGKVEIQGTVEMNGEQAFLMRFVQARDPGWVQRPFFARFDAEATWLNHLRPAFGEPRFFFEEQYEAMVKAAERRAAERPAAGAAADRCA